MHEIIKVIKTFNQSNAIYHQPIESYTKTLLKWQKIGLNQKGTFDFSKLTLSEASRNK